MIVLFETPAGYALFKVLNEGKLSRVDNIAKEFESPEKATSMVKLQAFSKFKDTTEALAAATASVESSLDKGLKKFLKKNVVSKDIADTLAIADAKLAAVIKKKLNINVATNDTAMEVMRGIRAQLATLVTGLGDDQLNAMYLGLAHSLGRYKLKFSPDKVDTMIVQAIGLLDELDKEINTYAMRVKEWYGWHFPEMVKIVTDNMQYAKCVLKMGVRSRAKDLDFSDILEEHVEEELKATAIVSMGTDIAEDDVSNIKALCEEVIEMTQYRAQLFEYLKSRMMAIAPNLTVMVGELVGARLIAHAGSLLNLAKAPASTVQILGAEKALFRALKTKSQTPKYGLIYHASLIGQAQPKHKGKISRVLAAKAALAIRVDALGESSDVTIGYEAREKVEARLRQLETGVYALESGKAKGRSKTEKQAGAPLHVGGGTGAGYNDAGDTVGVTEDAAPAAAEGPKKAKKEKKAKKRQRGEMVDAGEGAAHAADAATAAPAAAAAAAAEEDEAPKKKKKRKDKGDEAEAAGESKKKDKKKKDKKDKKKKKEAAE